MQLCNRNASAALFEKAQFLAEENTGLWRCLYVRLSGANTPSESLRKNFIERSINEALADMEGQVFCCEDGDIFILFHGELRPIAQRLSHYFDEVKPDMQTGQPKGELFTVLDLGIYWQLFYDLCRAKFYKSNRLYQAAIQRRSFVSDPQKV